MYDTIAGVKRSVSFSTVLTRRPRSLIRRRVFSKFLSLRTTSSLSRAPAVSQRFCLRSKFDSAKPLRRGPWLTRGTSGTGLWRQALVRFVQDLTHRCWIFSSLWESIIIHPVFWLYLSQSGCSCEIRTMSNDSTEIETRLSGNASMKFGHKSLSFEKNITSRFLTDLSQLNLTYINNTISVKQTSQKLQ